ncbi:MAG: DUF433 domain-containing protein [Planctomycetes bacterium]|nr:DUF433 domain-containing protein [Planctomycetota bacterium]
MVTTTEALIQKTPNLMGGEACIRRTRIAVWGLVDWKRVGWTDERLLANFVGLTQDDLNAAWAYYAEHPEEIDAAIQANDEA